MRWFLLAVLAVGMICGCARHRPEPKAGAAPKNHPKATRPIVTPDMSLVGKVVRASSVGRYAVVNFPIGRMAAVEQRLNVYRNKLKVGELKITGPQLDDLIVGDVVAGEVQVGDEVRNN